MDNFQESRKQLIKPGNQLDLCLITPLRVFYSKQNSPDFLFKPCLEALRTMTIDPELSRQLITLLSDRDNPASISKAIDLILSVCPARDAEELIFHIQCVDETGRVVPHEDTGLPTTIIKADWLAV